MKRTGMKTLLLAGLASALVLCSSVGMSMSYFTTYVTAEGSKTVRVVETIPSIHEDFDGMTKKVQVGCDSTSQRDCYVRVRLMVPLAADQYTVEASENWIRPDSPDGYWYYKPALAPGDTAPAEDILQITPDKDAVTEDFNIIVAVESAPVLYNEDGTAQANGPEYEGWKLTAKEADAAGTQP